MCIALMQIMMDGRVNLYHKETKMNLYLWLVDKIVLVAIWFIAAVVGSVVGIYIHATLMEIIK